MRHGGSDDIAEAQRPADENDFQFDGGTHGKLPGAKEINACGTDIASDKSDGAVLGNSTCATKTKRQVQSSARVFALLGVHANSVGGNTDETARLCGREKRCHAQCGKGGRGRDRLGAEDRFTRFRGGFRRPRFKWNGEFDCAHLALRDDTARSLAMAQQTGLQTNFLEFPRPHLSSAER
jgi:hypothetical protein